MIDAVAGLVIDLVVAIGLGELFVFGFFFTSRWELLRHV